MKRGKQAQFYIIAAIIIILIVLGMVGVSNYITVTEEPTSFYDLGENLELEGAWIIDYAIYDESDVNQTINEFTKNFAEYLAQSGEEFELVIAYGDNNRSCTQTYIKNTTGTINTGLGGVDTRGVIALNPVCYENQDSITIPFSDTNYEVDVKENENFLFVISTSKGFENYVYSNI